MLVISLRRPDIAQAAILMLLTLAALALLGWTLAYWSWVWFAPPPESRAQPAADPVVAPTRAMGLFGMPPRNDSRPASAGVAVRLLGVVAAVGGRRGYAVMQVDRGDIRVVSEGEDIVPGVGLAEIHADRVVLARDGAREAITWPEKNTPAAAAPRVVR